MQRQKETAQEELKRAKKEIQTDKLKGAATTAATNIAESVGSLFGSNKVKTLERENTALHREVATHGEMLNPARFTEKKCGAPFVVYRTLNIFVCKVIYLKKVTTDFAVSITLVVK